eukprot:scaffold120_cov202-Prasinococcus_capsulatus_cf.AAC.2
MDGMPYDACCPQTHSCRPDRARTNAECCIEEDVGLLAYSPLAMGLLTGKYHSPSTPPPPTARLVKYKGKRRNGWYWVLMRRAMLLGSQLASMVRPVAGRYAEAESRYCPSSPNVTEAIEVTVHVAAVPGPVSEYRG